MRQHLSPKQKPSKDYSLKIEKRRFELSLILFIVGMSVRFYSLGFELVPYGMGESDLFRNLGHSILTASFLFAILERKLYNLQRKYLHWLVILGFAFIFLLIYGIYRGTKLMFIAPDLFAFTYFSGVLVGSERRNWIALEKMLCVHFFIGIIANIYAFASFPLPALRSFLVWTLPYMLQGLLYPWPYFLLTFNRGGIYRKLLTIVGLSVVLISFILFQKRIHTFSFLFFGLFSLYLYTVKGKVNVVGAFKKVTKIACLLLILTMTIFFTLKIMDQFSAFSQSIKGLQSRIFLDSDSGNVMKAFTYSRYKEESRYEEASHYFSHASGFELIFGRGIGGFYFTPLVGVSSTGFTGRIHIGLATLILKGGVLFLTLWLFGWLMILKDFLKVKKDQEFIFCYPIIAKYVVFLTVATALSDWLSFGLVLLCSGPCMSKWIRNDKQMGN